MKYYLYEKKEIKSDKKRLYIICDIIHEKTYKFVFYENMNEEFSKHEKFKQFATHIYLMLHTDTFLPSSPRHLSKTRAISCGAH